MKKSIIAIMLIASFFQLFSQKEDANWILGYGPGRDTLTQSIYQIQFSDSLIIEQKNISFYMDAANASVSDKNGNLACYTNGYYLNNGNHRLVKNGGEFQDDEEDRFGLYVTQGTLLLPLPKQENKYIFLLTDYFRWHEGLAA